MTTPIRLSPAEFTACWVALELGATPAVLTGCGAGNGFGPKQRRAALLALAERGLSDTRLPSVELAERLRLIATAPHLLDIQAGGSHGRLVGLGAVSGSRGVALATRDGDTPLKLVAMDGIRVAATLLGLLGPVTPGAGRTVNIPADVLDSALNTVRDGSLWTLADKLQARGVPRVDASSLVRMCEGMYRRGQLGVITRFGAVTRRAPWTVGMHATPAGWFLQLRRDYTVTVAPVDTVGLLRHWRELVGQVTPAPC